MQRYPEIVNELEDEDLEYLLVQITDGLEHKIDSLVPIRKLARFADKYDLTDSDFILFQDVSNHVLVESTTNKTFDSGEALLEKLGVNEVQIKLFQKVFQEQAQTIWKQIKDRAHATDNVVDRVSTRITLPLYESHNPISQNFTFNNKIKFEYSDDVKNPRLQLRFNFKPETSGKKPKWREPVVAELEKMEVQKLFEETERIKAHLDMLLAKV